MSSKFCFAFMDCEFGGLDLEIHDITEVGVIFTDDRLVEHSEQQWRVKARPERISDEAAAIFGYDEALWAEAPPIRQVLKEITAMVPKGKVCVPAGQNVRMDVAFLERAFRKCEIPYPFDYHVIDLATLFYTWTLVAGEPARALSLRQAATTAGLLGDGGVAHRALADARLTLETFRHYIGRLAPRDLTELVPQTSLEPPENAPVGSASGADVGKG
ncbi:MAG TPA: 3'-5' exonuclease [Myxococcales bacterium]|nr:3'-5' exonuclease [Myxococcales bacterium]HIL02758.1 3'-5' exonuclease [Myxococcales bacterium]